MGEGHGGLEWTSLFLFLSILIKIKLIQVTANDKAHDIIHRLKISVKSGSPERDVHINTYIYVIQPQGRVVAHTDHDYLPHKQASSPLT